MINKIVYIGYQPLTEKVKEDFFFIELMENGISIEYWDLSNIYFPNLFKNVQFNEYIIIIKSLKEFSIKLKNENIENTLFITNIAYEFKVLVLYRLLSKYKCKTSFFARGALPDIYSESKIKDLKSKFIKIFNIKLLLNFLKNKLAFLYKKLGFINPHYIVFKAGDNGLQTIGLAFKIDEEKSKIVNINYFDYDKYFQIQDENIVKNKYCVFLDEYLPYHPDCAMVGDKSKEPINYYNKLNEIFDIIEEKYSIEVIIAAHPKAEKYEEINYFNNRRIYFNKSALLVKYSEFVITHCSTSLSFAILNKKPIISLVYNKINEIVPNYFKLICNFSKIIDSILLNIDEIKNTKDLELIKKPNKHIFNDYKYKYLTSKESETKYTSDIFIETILNL